MFRPSRIISTLLASGCVLLLLAGAAAAQKNAWEERILRDHQVRPVAGESIDEPLLGTAESDFATISLDPVPEDAEAIAPGTLSGKRSHAGSTGSGCAECGGGGDESIGCMDECDSCTMEYACGPRGRLLHRFSLFAGVQGFKGPLDQGRNGNFGFHEGVNFGAPLGGPWGIGYQLGAQGVHSNFSGSQVVGTSRADRDQVFFTAGLFHRPPEGGFQWGVAFDALHDNYYEKSDLTQLRAELGLLSVGPHDVGFWGSFGLKNDEIPGATLKQTDLFTLFYRRHFSGGGEGRLWGGCTGKHDALVGGDVRVPLGTHWALENSFNYLIPNESRGTRGLREESWSVVLQLVWYPGRPAHCIGSDPFQPVLGVADNSTFMVDYAH